MTGQGPTIGSRPVSPDCRDGKHRACTGAALDPETDDIVACVCRCCAHTGEHRWISDQELGSVIVRYRCAWCGAEKRTRIVSTTTPDPDRPGQVIISTEEVPEP